MIDLNSGWKGLLRSWILFPFQNDVLRILALEESEMSIKNKEIIIFDKNNYQELEL